MGMPDNGARLSCACIVDMLSFTMTRAQQYGIDPESVCPTCNHRRRELLLLTTHVWHCDFCETSPESVGKTPTSEPSQILVGHPMRGWKYALVNKKSKVDSQYCTETLRDRIEFWMTEDKHPENASLWGLPPETDTIMYAPEKLCDSDDLEAVRVWAKKTFDIPPDS